MRQDKFTISQVSVITGLPASTIRYYESIGLIPEVAREASSGRRLFSRQDCHTLTQLSCLSASGMALEEVREYMKRVDNTDPESARIQRAIFRTHKRKLVEQARVLKLRAHYADLKMAYWEAIEHEDTERATELDNEARDLAQELRTLTKN
ncbi:MAG: MerR family transcriptional regulator [Corynebacterium sp.]|nr:MerR family transcriptional regulator [Corynebacterium sp.]